MAYIPRGAEVCRRGCVGVGVGEPGGRVVGFVTSPPARRISGRGVVRWNGRSTLVPIPVGTKTFRVEATDGRLDR